MYIIVTVTLGDRYVRIRKLHFFSLRVNDHLGSLHKLHVLLQRPSMKNVGVHEDVGVTSGQKPSTKIIYIVLQTSVGLL